MKIFINGKLKEISSETTILKLLEEEDIEDTISIEVILNGKQIKQEDYPKIKLRENDKIEYIFLFASG